MGGQVLTRTSGDPLLKDEYRGKKKARRQPERDRGGRSMGSKKKSKKFLLKKGKGRAAPAPKKKAPASRKRSSIVDAMAGGGHY